MFVAKPHKKGAVAELDASESMEEVQDLATLSGAQNLNTIDNMPYNNPDAAAGNVAAKPDFRGGYPQGNMRMQNVSGGGRLQKTAQNTAPKANPFPAPSRTVRTSPSTIKE